MDHEPDRYLLMYNFDSYTSKLDLVMSAVHAAYGGG